MQFIRNSIWSFLNIMSFFTDLPKTESAILSTLWKFEGCLGVEGWLKTGNTGHYFQAWFSVEVSAKFFSSFVDQKLGWAPGVTTRKLLISEAKVTQLWLGILQHLARCGGDPHFLLHICSLHVSENILFKIWKKSTSIWYFYHARGMYVVKWKSERYWPADLG